MFHAEMIKDECVAWIRDFFEHNGAGEIKLVAERAYELVPFVCHAARKPSVVDRVLSYYFIVLTNGSPKLHAVCSSFQGKDQGGVSAAPCEVIFKSVLGDVLLGYE